MDYKYIEQLLERYWQCESSLGEERVLCAFFRQENIPAHLAQYTGLFVYWQVQRDGMKLGDDFDAKVLAVAGKPVVKAKRLTAMGRFMPLFKAAAVVALVLTLGNMAQRSFFKEDSPDYNYDAYKDTYHDPQMAYKQLSSALMMVSEGINKSQDKLSADSLAQSIEYPDTVVE